MRNGFDMRTLRSRFERALRKGLETQALRRLGFVIVAMAASGAPVLPALAEKLDGGTGIAHGKDHAYFLTAPEGWTLDTSCGAGQGIYCCFYPKGSNWNGPVVMYSNASAKDDRTVLQAIEHDIKEFREKSPHVKVDDGGVLTTSDGKKALVRNFTGDKWANHEAVGYVGEKSVVVNIVMTARKKGDYDASIPAFRKLVSSYKFITDTPEKVDLFEIARKNSQLSVPMKKVEEKGNAGRRAVRSATRKEQMRSAK